MSLFDLCQRAEAVLSKYVRSSVLCDGYEKYDAPEKLDKGKSDDPFMEEYAEVEEEVQKLIEASGEVALEDSRSLIAQKYAEIRRAKQVLLGPAVEALRKKVKKGKGVSKMVIADRESKINEIIDRIYAIPDGTSAGTRRPVRLGAKGSKRDPIILDNTVANKAHASGYHNHTDATQTFEKDYEMSKARQDAQLDRIAGNVDRLGDIARNMQEEVERQNPIINDIEQQMDKVTGQLKTNNAKMAGLVKQMRSSRNFCVDVILICVILAIGAYVYSMFR
ncbi:hypothetical protein QJQ45_002102 [Haematococcus lacustris]|nr:hypothetical protein QJQ45_002102 [Haematococcus lacustris]